MSIDGQALFESFNEEYQSDDESWQKKGESLFWLYECANEKEKAIADDIFITLCGWSLKTLIKNQEEK